MRTWIFSLSMALTVAACSHPAARPDAGTDAGVADAAGGCAFANGTRCGGPGSANSGCPGSSCNWCDCGVGWGDDPNHASCTQAGCPAPADAGADYLRCHSQSDCPQGYACIFNVGCDQTLGQCNGQTFYCPHDPRTFTLCDCDGKTITDTVNSCAPDRPYAHAGACP